MNNYPILMTEEYWANSYFSVVRYTGQMKYWGRTYVVVNKHGRTVFETSIQPGEPADLIWRDMIPAYKKLGRDLFIELLKLRADEYLIQACARLAIKSVAEARQRKEDVDALAGKLREKDAKKKRKEATI